LKDEIVGEKKFAFHEPAGEELKDFW